MSSPPFATLQARIQSRHGQRLELSQWRRLAAVAEIEPFLAQARDTALEGWLGGIDPDTDIHHLEAVLRETFIRQVILVAGWSPPAWQAAILWVKTWPDLAAAIHWRRFGATHPWMRHLEALEKQPTPPEGQDALGWWLHGWRSRWPDDAKTDFGLQSLLHLARQPIPDDETPWSAWSQLRSTLELRFRRYAMQPAALFVHLWLTGLDLYRLRGELSRRLLFPRESQA